jgi:hypothetical protein
MPQVFDPLGFEVEHIIALKHHGLSEESNLALACFACNRHKGPNLAGLDPQTGQLTRIFHPRTDDWQSHFRWSGPHVLGLTDIGRTTIDVLEINAPLRVAHREALIEEGVFPLTLRPANPD